VGITASASNIYDVFQEVEAESKHNRHCAELIASSTRLFSDVTLEELR